MTLIQYTLDDFTSQIHNGIDYRLPESIMTILDTLSGQLQIADSPEPAHQNTIHRRPAKPASKLVDNQTWARTKPFKTTSIEQKTGIDKTLNDIRYCLNNISEINYAAQLRKIVDSILSIESLGEETAKSVAECIRDGASTNKMNAHLYARLYSEVVQSFLQFAQFPRVFSEQYLLDLTAIQCVAATDDFERFSAYNKANDKRKGLVGFLVFLMKEGLIESAVLDSVVQSLVDLVCVWIEADGKTSEVDEVTDNIAIFAKMMDCKSCAWFETIQAIAKYKAKEHKSLSSRSVFKFMDMIGA
jgi:hypothetical protein